MYRKVIKYTDYDGIEREEEFRFNLSKGELADWHLSTEGGLDALLDKIVKSKDQIELHRIFKEILQKSYGVKSADGRRFMKDPEYFKEFSETEAYSEFLIKLVTDENEAVAFINGIIPKEE